MQKDTQNNQPIEVMAVLALACIVIGFLLEHNVYLYALSGLFLVIGLFSKPLAALISKLWGKIGHILGAINTRIILATLFFIVLTPIALLTKLIKGDLIGLKQKTGATRSYWHVRNHKFSEADLKHPW